jgi:hypothetical protein
MVLHCADAYDTPVSTITIAKPLRYIGLPEEIANEARQTLRDRFGHDLQPVREEAPCRVCLRTSKEPEELILLSYQPLVDTNPYAEVGPIFIHAHGCEPYSEVETFPEDFSGRRLILRAYSNDGRILDAIVAEPGTAPEGAAALFANPAVAEIHVRHESYTCFDFKIVRGS